MLLPESEVRARVLSTATLERDLAVCDLTVKRALKAGVTAALTAGADYTEAHALADALQDRHPAVRWRLRHGGIAWFGDAGSATTGALADLHATETADITDDLVERACRTFGYTVLPDPPS